MNSFDNDQNEINDGYRRDFGQEGSGEYSYSYTPNNKARQTNRKPRAWMIAIILVAVFALAFSTVVGALALNTFFGSCIGNGVVTVNSGSGSQTRGANAGEGGAQNQPAATPKLDGESETHSESFAEGSCYAVDHGISTIDVTAENLFCYRRYGIAETGAIVIASEYSEQIVFGDRIVAVNGQNISCSKDIENALEGCTVGQKVYIVLLRDGECIGVEILLYEEVPEYIDF